MRGQVAIGTVLAGFRVESLIGEGATAARLFVVAPGPGNRDL